MFTITMLRFHIAPILVALLQLVLLTQPLVGLPIECVFELIDPVQLLIHYF